MFQTIINARIRCSTDSTVFGPLSLKSDWSTEFKFSETLFCMHLRAKRSSTSASVATTVAGRCLLTFTVFLYGSPFKKNFFPLSNTLNNPFRPRFLFLLEFLTFFLVFEPFSRPIFLEEGRLVALASPYNDLGGWHAFSSRPFSRQYRSLLFRYWYIRNAL